MTAKSLKNRFPVFLDFLRAGVGGEAPHVRGQAGGGPYARNTRNTRNNNINNLPSYSCTPPAIPAQSPRKVRGNPERGIQRALLGVLATRLPLGAVVLHVPNQDATQSAAYGRAKLLDGVLPGCPDLLIVYRSQAFWLELKAPDGTPSAEQLAAHRRLRAAGTPVEIAYSVDDALAALEAWGLIAPNQGQPR